MAKFSFQNAKISGISFILGENKRLFEDEPFNYNHNEAQMRKLKDTIGFGATFWANTQTTTADLSFEAILSLQKALNFELSSVEAIISVTQTPDFYMPANAHVLHKRLNLSKDCMAYDLEFGCSGYIYGLYAAFSMINLGLKRVLLVVGDTISKCVNSKDRTVAPVLSDGASATLIEFCEDFGKSYFVLKSDGQGLNHLIQPAGAYRMRPSEKTREVKVDEHGNHRCLEDFHMNGLEVFSFTLREQPSLINEILDFAALSKDEIDFFIFHQANNYIVETIIKKAKIEPKKAPSKIFTKYGNQNGASVPLAICEDLRTLLNSRKKLLLQGFGIGLSWGACVVDFENTICLKPQIYGNFK